MKDNDIKHAAYRPSAEYQMLLRILLFSRILESRAPHWAPQAELVAHHLDRLKRLTLGLFDEKIHGLTEDDIPAHLVHAVLILA